MKKNLVLIALMLLTCINTFAQSSLIATLSHDGQIKAFYGTTAFEQAHTAAIDGDIITLSGGTFTATKITKAITLRGAGMLPDNTQSQFPTVIQGDMNISLSAPDSTKRLILEGIKFANTVSVRSDLIKPCFQKCLFTDFTYYASTVKQGIFTNCFITNYFSFNNSSTITFINSFVSDDCYSGSCSFEFQNCVIKTSGYDSYIRSLSGISNSTFNNCIIVGVGNCVGSIPESSLCFNCVATGTADQAFKNIKTGNNKVISDITTIFKEFTGTNYYDGISFTLTDNASLNYLGTDGTQVGIFGGPLPFDPRTNTLRIVRCNVANKSTADGKLSVDIEISGVE